MNYAIILAPLLSLSAWQWSGLCHTEQTLNFLNQALSSWCQEKCPFPVSASSPPSNSLFAVWHLFLPQYWNYLSEAANDDWIAVKSNSFYPLFTSALPAIYTVCWHTLLKHFCLLMLGILYKLRGPQLFLILLLMAPVFPPPGSGCLYFFIFSPNTFFLRR